MTRTFLTPPYPGLVDRAVLRFETTFFRALAELLEDIGAAAYLEFAVRDELTLRYDELLGGVHCPRRGCGAHFGRPTYGPFSPPAQTPMQQGAAHRAPGTPPGVDPPEPDTTSAQAADAQSPCDRCPHFCRRS